MTVAELMGELQQMVIEYPETAEMKAITESEGGFFQPINYAPSVGRLLMHEFDEECSKSEHNAVCINQELKCQH